MKKHIAVIMSLALGVAAQAKTVQFDLSPAGTDAAIGLSPLNEVPARTNSTGSGGEISAGISYNTDTAVMTLALGLGSVAGFTDLTAPATAAHIHSPAGPGTNAGVIVHLTDLFFTQGDPAKGAVIFGQVNIPTNHVENLLAGLTYINVHNTNYPGGEIRGQLIPIINNPPVLVCPAPSTLECGGATTVSAQVSDPEGDALTVTWTVNGAVVKTSNLPAGTTTTPTPTTLTAEFPLGTNAITVTVADTGDNTVSCSTTLVVVDTIPPVITRASVTPSVIWPPNHKMIPVSVTAVVTDVCSATTWKIISITSNEAADAIGSGNTEVDYEITGAHTANVRSERSGKTGPRLYTITIEAIDAAGNKSRPVNVIVTVPHSKGPTK